jgi:protease secretion system membrane fusion protein
MNSPKQSTDPIDNVRQLPTATPAAAETVLDMNDAKQRRWGWLLLLVGFGGFLLWAGLAPLDAGTPASGLVVVSGNRKAVQPLTGGKISEISVKDGDLVKEGQVLVRLDPTQARSQLDIATGQWYSSMAVEARMMAERLGLDTIRFPEELLKNQTDPRAANAISLQTALFLTRKRTFAGEMAVVKESIGGTLAQIQGLEESKKAKQEQLRLLQEELRNQRELANEGYLPRNRLSEQERLVASINGAISEDIGNIGRARQSVAEAKARMNTREQELRKELESQLTEVQKESSALVNRIQALKFELANTEIKAPVEGIVVGLSVHTIGGVVGAGAALMEIVPASERLKIEAQIAPHLIDKVHPGLDVDIMFPAFNQATTPHVPGKLVNVSADVLFEQKQNLPYYKASVEVTEEGMKALRHHQIRPGMPAEVFMRAGERTFLSYLFKPLKDRIRGALTEQ